MSCIETLISLKVRVFSHDPSKHVTRYDCLDKEIRQILVCFLSKNFLFSRILIQSLHHNLIDLRLLLVRVYFRLKVYL